MKKQSENEIITLELPTSFELQFKKTRHIENNVLVQINKDEICIKRKDGGKQEKEQNRQVNNAVENPLVASVKFIDMLSVAKNCKQTNLYKIIIFTTNSQDEGQEQQFEEQDQQDQQDPETKQKGLQLQMLDRLQSHEGNIEVRGRFILTISFELGIGQKVQKSCQEKTTNLQRLQQQLIANEKVEKNVDNCNQFYESIVGSLNKMEVVGQSCYNNKGIFGLFGQEEEMQEQEELGDEIEMEVENGEQEMG